MQQLIVSTEEDLRRIIAEEVSRIIGNQPAEVKEPRFLTRKEAAALLHITLPTLRKWVVNGMILEKRIGSRILYAEDELTQAVRDRSIYKFKREA